MKIIASWIAESVIAAAVIVVCMGLPEVFDLPAWTLAVAAFPMAFYLKWRLRLQQVSWRDVVWVVLIIDALMLMDRYVLPKSWRDVIPIVSMICVWAFASRLKRNKEEKPPIA